MIKVKRSHGHSAAIVTSPGNKREIKQQLCYLLVTVNKRRVLALERGCKKQLRNNPAFH